MDSASALSYEEPTLPTEAAIPASARRSVYRMAVYWLVSPGWMLTHTGRPAMRSPGRPPVRRDVERAFWVRVAEGLSSEDAAVAVGVSGPVGSRWFRERGGMPLIELGPSSGRYLSFAEREEIALLRTQGRGVREIARQLRRSASTISRELRRNAATRGGRLDYRAGTAQWKAD
jgi:transposase